MAGINLGLAAVDQYYKADDARVLREQQRQAFDWEKQRTESDLSILPERTAAAKSALQLQNANNQSELDMAPNKAAVAKALSQYAVEDLPSAIADMKRKRVFSDADAATAGIAKLGELIKIGDPQQVVTYLNAWRKTNPSQHNGQEVAQVGFQKDPTSGENVFIAMDGKGNPIMQMSASQIQRIQDSIGKTDLKVVKPGETLIGTKNGVSTPMFTNPIDGNKFLSPLERDATALMNTYPGMSKQQAMTQLIFKKGTSLQDHMVQSSAAFKKEYGRAPSQRELDGFKQEYENATNTARNSSGQPSSSAPKPQHNSGVDWRDWTGTK